MRRLMKLISPLKVRIQHIAPHAQSAILAARESVAYLRTLIRSDRDWTQPPRQDKPQARIGSVKSASMNAGERQSAELRSKQVTDQALRAAPPVGYREGIAAMKQALALHRLTGAG